ncbi:dipeptidase [Paenibacillus sp. DCT19]|uniref:dipeptidase n=1 Tax=Paenibacillus sp. DCT19 TaxID=2211212 RepID=UPI000FE1ECA7|nr:dipeptidase [Paenibacillus sp. DCT19]
MNVIDLHCDALFRIWRAGGKLAFDHTDSLEASKPRLIAGQVKVQGFAIFVPPNLKDSAKFEAALDQVHYFYTEILDKNPEIIHITDWSQIRNLRDGEIGAFLTLEGVDPIGNDLHKLNLLYRLGVRSVGLTWNYANLAADGALEPRGSGLTQFGKQIIEFNNEYRLLSDVSHLSEAGFWDVLQLADYPIASHSNAQGIYNHPRNLSDEQAQALFAKNATVHVLYLPDFLRSDQDEAASIDDVLRHVEHFCSIGGVKHIGLGSDFDGLIHYVEGLEHAGHTQNLINALLKRYSEQEVKGFASENFLNSLSAYQL